MLGENHVGPIFWKSVVTERRMGGPFDSRKRELAPQMWGNVPK
jgi:hypothetical protein